MKKQLLMGLSITFLLLGCGSSSSDDTTNETTSSTTPILQTGQYIDSAIGGVSYTCGNQKGVTTSDGKFTYEEGSGCEFKIGSLSLRAVSADELKENNIVIEDNILNAQLLQSLDIDNNASNGINITSEEAEVLNDFSSIKDTTDIEEIIDKINQTTNLNLSLKQEDDVAKHLKDTYTDLIKGILSNKVFYAVSYNSDLNSSFINKVTINDTANQVTIEGYKNSDKNESGELVIEGLSLSIYTDNDTYALNITQFNDNEITALGMDNVYKLFDNIQNAENYADEISKSKELLGDYVGKVSMFNFKYNYTYSYGSIEIQINKDRSGTLIVKSNADGVITKNFTLDDDNSLYVYIDDPEKDEIIEIWGQFNNNFTAFSGHMDINDHSYSYTRAGDFVALKQ